MFKKYDKVSKLNRVETHGLTEGLCYVQPKLDGTNASVWMEDGVVCVGSRNRIITVDDDNAGFAKWVSNSPVPALLTKLPQLHLFGEWLVPHTVRGYKEKAWRDFYVFDVFNKETMKWMTPDEYYQIMLDYDISVVPYRKVSNPSAIDLDVLRERVSEFQMRDGEVGEGIVVKNYAYLNKFGFNTHAKYLNEEFAQSTGRAKGAKRLRECPVEEELAERMVDRGLILKTQSKIEVAEGGWSQKYIGRLLETVWYDAMHEELYDALKKMKYPIVNFGMLKGQVTNRIKAEAKEFF